MNMFRIVTVLFLTALLSISVFISEAFAISKEIKILGPRSRSQIDSVIKRNLPRIRKCYEKKILANKMSDAEIYIDLLVDSKGKVVSSSIKQSEYPGLKNKALSYMLAFEKCAVDSMLKIKFPGDKNKSLTRISYPISLKKRKVEIPPTAKIEPLFESFDLKVSKGLTDEQISNELTRNTDEINECYKAAISLDRTIQGTVKYSWKIGSDGQVNEMQKKGSGLKGKKDLMGKKYLENCIVKKVKEILFPIPGDSKQVKVSVKFKF